jgi:DNA-binding CsgD family transcriptional regulator
MHAVNDQLTNREREVLCLLASGHTDRRIAESLTISPRTVNRHMSNIFAKLAVLSRTAAAVHAVRNGLI